MCHYFLCFAFYSFIGWAYESVYYTLQQRKWVNSGFFNGAWCPIYGVGACLILIFLGDIENPVELFVAGMVLTGSLEYFVSFAMEGLFGKRWWDYTGWPLNINGRICIVSIAAFGFFAVLLVKYVSPFTLSLIGRLSERGAACIAAAVAAAMLADLIMSVKEIDKCGGKLWYVREQEHFFEEFKGELIRKIKNIHR